MFLTDTELKEMTGYKQPAAVMRWLDREGFCYRVGADGWPRVMRDVVIAGFQGQTVRRKPQLRFA